MKYFSTLLALVILLALFALPAHARAVHQKQSQPARPKKAAPVEYVCPMHDDVTSKERGTCPKCKMELVKRRPAKRPEAN